MPYDRSAVTLPTRSWVAHRNGPFQPAGQAVFDALDKISNDKKLIFEI